MACKNTSEDLSLPKRCDLNVFSEMQVTTSPVSKRKFAERGSSGDEGTPLLKKQNSSSLPDISNLGRSSFTHMVTKTFEDADFVSEIAPILSGILTPFIQKSIAAAVGALQESIVNPLLDNNEKLVATIQSQSATIEAQKKDIATQSENINSLEEELKSLRCEIKNLTSNFQNLTLEKNDLEQYSRRYLLRLYNLPVPDNIDSEQALTDHITRFINSEVLKVNSSADPSAIHPSDIDRCNFVGKQKKQILVKFMRYESKRKVFMNKINLV